jgi:hypothetical protein
MVVDAVPIGADGWVTGRRRRRGCHRVRKDSETSCLSIEDHSIQLGGERTQLRLDVVDGAELGGEIRDGGVDAGLPGDEVVGRLLHQLESVAEGALQAIHVRLHQGKAVAELLHLIQQKLGGRIHDAKMFLEAGEVVVVGI